MRDDDAARLALVIGRINRRIRPADGALTVGQLSALSTILRRGPLRPGDLGRLESVAAPVVTRLIAGLERRGLVRKEADPDDRRSFFVSATAAGEQAVRHARGERARRISTLLEQLDDDERAAVAGALDALERMAVTG